MDKQKKVESRSDAVALQPIPWNRPCDFCGEPADINGKTKYGAWADMCEDCHKVHGVGMGVGCGSLITVGV